ncbi:MAG: tetratricopeptide repeat protein, partial [Anaerolineae bacterium]
ALRRATGRELPLETSATRESFLAAAPFIGRESEVLLLSHTLDRIRKGFQPHGAWGSLWLIGGESGVGKTRLVREMRTRALVEGITVLEGSAVEGGGLPYQIWREPMRKLCLLADLSDEDAAVLKRLVPDIDTLLRRRVPELPDISDEMAWAHLVATIARVLHQTSEPMLLILEDIHWAGRGLDVLNIVSELIAYRPMMILATYRTEEAPDLPDEFPRAHSITLDRFTDEEVEALVTAMLGGSTPQMLDLLRRETEGNPLFVVEAVRALAEEAGGLTAIDPTPQVLSVGGIRAMLRRRLDRVPPAARPLLKLSALLGRDIDRSLLEAGAKVLDLGPVDIDWWQVACSSAAVLEFHEGVARFAHDQLRATVIDGLTEAEHRDLHRAAAQALEAVYPDDPAWAATLLEHWQAAGEPLKESQYAVDAGEQALLVGENERAVSLLEQALDLLWKRTDLDMDAASALEIRLLRLLGDAHRALSHFERARTYYEACVDRATRVRNRQAVADALNGLGGLAYYEADYARAAAHWQESLALRRMLNDEEGIASALGNLGLIADARGDLETALAYMAESVTRRRAIGEPRGLARSLNNQGITLYNHGAFAEAHAAFAEALEIAQSIGDRPTIAHVLNNLGLLQVDIGEFEHARSSHREALEIRRELGDKMLTAASLQNLGIVLLKQGAVETAQSHFEDAIASSEQVGDREGVALTSINLGQVALADSDYRRARAAFDNALVDLQDIANPPGIAEALIGLGRCAFDQRRVETAHRHFTDALTLAREMDARPLVAQALSALVPVHLALGERDQAEAVLQEGFALAWELGALPLALDLLLGAAQLSLERGDGERAGAYAALVERHPATERDTRMRLTRVRLQLIGTLDSRAMARATQLCMLLDLDEAAADLIGSVV